MTETYEQITAKIQETPEPKLEEPKLEEVPKEVPKLEEVPEETPKPEKKGRLQEKIECPDCGKRVSRSTLKYNKHTCYKPPPPPPGSPKRSMEAPPRTPPEDPTQLVLESYRKIKAAQIDSRKQKYATWLESF